ncbi:peroxide stress protein YaaA [Betaproteobacteria bacterium]|nr:peroxide stress protein YaaA [Betaproteobacteria bacterium]
MLILLSPAKTFNFESIPNRSTGTTSIFQYDTKALINILQTLSEKDYQKLMKISPKLAALNRDRHLSFPNISKKGSMQAIFAFYGDVYTSLKVEDLTEKELDFAQDNLRILSGLYGILRPFDLIKPHRLEMGTALKNTRGDNLYHWWGPKIADSLNEEIESHRSKIFINLASEEYYKSIKGQLSKTVITPIFQERKGNEFKVIGISAKRARGLMARFIIKNKIFKVDKLKLFSSAGYKFNEKLSSQNTMIFQKN